MNSQTHDTAPTCGLKTTKINCAGQDCLRAYSQLFLPSHLVWDTQATTLADRCKAYTKILEHTHSATYGYPAGLNRFRIYPKRNNQGPYAEEGPLSPTWLKGNENDPLYGLRVQQPHLSHEIDTFYFETCEFVIGDKCTEDSIPASLRWLQHIGAFSVSRLQQLRIRTAAEKITADSESLINIIRLAGTTRGYTSIESVDLCVEVSAEVTFGDRDLFVSNVKISGLNRFVLQLQLYHEGRDFRLAIAHAFEKLFQTDWEAWYREKTETQIVTWFFSLHAPRVSFLKRLPAEIRALVYKKVNQNFDLTTASRTETWSALFHCHRNHLVSHLFAEESCAAFYNARAFELRLQLDEDYETVHGFLKLAGPEHVKSMNALTFFTDCGFPNLGQLPKVFSWLINTLNVSVSMPRASFEVRGLKLSSWDIDAITMQHVLQKGFHSHDIEELLRNYPEYRTQQVTVKVKAITDICLVNQAINPFRFQMNETISMPLANLPAVIEELVAPKTKALFETTFRCALRGGKTDSAVRLWNKVLRLANQRV